MGDLSKTGDLSKYELRRRKILENAESRLQKITGRVKNIEVSPDPDKEVQSRKEVEIEPSTHKLDASPFLPTHRHEEINVTPEFPTSASEKISYAKEEPLFVDKKESVNGSNSRDCLIFLALALLVRLMYFWGISWIFYEKLLVPFVVVCLSLAILGQLSSPAESNSLFFSLLHLLRISPLIIRKAQAFYDIARHLLQLFSLYIFFFILFHCLLEIKHS